SILLEKPGEIVTRDWMLKRLWASDTFVDFEHSLNTAIKKLRAALGDTPENSRYIETVPRMGYRFIAPVEQVAAAGPPVDVSLVTDRSGIAGAALHDDGKRERRLLVGVTILLIVVPAAYYAGYRFRSHPQPQTKVVR